jgi:hypothetical protein
VRSVLKLSNVFRPRGGVDVAVELKYSVPLVEVPAPQALYNLYSSCVGNGFPLSLLSGLVERRGRSGSLVPVDVRFSAVRYFNGVRFYTGVISKRYIEGVVRLRAHAAPVCTEFVKREGDALLGTALGWERPLLVVCQYPARALHRQYESLPELLAKSLGIKRQPALVEQYLPGLQLVDSLFRKIPEAKYPFTHTTCGDGGNVEECTTEAVLVALDEHVATMLYAVNTRSLHPQARAATRTLVETPEVQLLGSTSKTK